MKKAALGISLEREGNTHFHGPREQVGKAFVGVSKTGKMKACVHNKKSYEVLLEPLLFVFSE